MPRVRRARAERYAAAGRTYCLLADYAARVAEVTGAKAAMAELRRRYLQAAMEVAVGACCEEADRDAILGMVALERGDLPLALVHLERAVVDPAARREDHLVRIEALVRSGNLGAARRAAEQLLACHPSYELGREIAAGLGLGTAVSGAPA